MRLPSLSIAHQLALLIATCVVLAVAAVGGVSLWNLQSGFGEYLRLRDEEQLTRLMVATEKRALNDPQLNWLRGNREAMRELQDDALGLELGPRGRPPRGPNPSGPRSGPEDRPGPPPHAPPSGPPPPAPPGSLRGRVVIFDAHGTVVAGRALPPGKARSVRAIKVRGEVVGNIELAAEEHPEGIDARFLQRQTAGLAYAAAGAIALALLLGWWFAQGWSRPLRALQTATRRIANGDLRVEVGGESSRFSTSAREIDLLMGDVNAMAASLATMEQTRRTWIAQISHELRTPLAVLRGELEAIEDGARQPSAMVLKGLRDEVMQLTRLVDDLHLLSMADLGQLPCELLAHADADTALRQWVMKFSTRAQALGLDLDVQSPSKPFAVQWDMGRIEQLITNLLENSLRYTQAPGRTIVRWVVQPDRVSISVEDSPPGVPPELHQQLFDPLFRVDTARTRTGQHGSGLGLSIVRAIVRAHGGSVTAENSSLGGLRIVVELPLRPLR